MAKNASDKSARAASKEGTAAGRPAATGRGRQAPRKGGTKKERKRTAAQGAPRRRSKGVASAADESAAEQAALIEALRGRIRQLEHELERARQEHGTRAAPVADTSSAPPTAEPEQPAAQHRTADIDEAGPEQELGPQPPDAHRALLTSDYFMRKWGRLGIRRRTEELDEYGLDTTYESRLKPLLDFLFASYFRVDVQCAHHVPSDGRCLIVANHSGGPIPYDGLLLRCALRLEHPRRRRLRWLSEDAFQHLPFVGTFMTRLGAVRACQENAQRLLRQGYAVAVFPEGVKGVGKLYRNRYRLQRFGRGGYIRLCLRTQTPLVPCALVGAEEANPMLYRFEYLTRALRMPYLPITPTFPWLGPLGLLPAPTKCILRFAQPMHFDGYAPDAAADEVLVGRLSDRVRATIQSMLDEILAKRQSVFFG